MLVHLGDVPAVHDGARERLRPADRVARVDELLRELVGELVVLGPDGELAERGAQMMMMMVMLVRRKWNVAHSPDWSRVGGRRGALPKGRAQNEELILEVRCCITNDRLKVPGLRPWLRMGNAEACREEFVSDRVLATAAQRQAKVFVCWVREVQGVDDVPDLAQGRGLISAFPFQGRHGSATGACPGAIV